MTDDPMDVPSSSGAEFSGHDERLTAILADPTLPDRDKRQAIQDAFDDLVRERGDEPAAAYETIERRFFEALTLLAEGGHDYDDASDHGGDAPPDRRPGEI
ncbi:hypothetical protein D3218_07560 [Aureimonas flava]|uniref:Uncharacterized protein n=1 Tax=Aureimonas flava TaxID=2320271 RepID=A0A3A1WMQ3_9HYPH|nr:hypothetical protein D3218_07560 [Aureimonas flava]